MSSTGDDSSRNSTGDDSRIGLLLNGRYRITERLAEGGMGVVYKGERIQLGKPVAIKFLLEPFTDDLQFMTRFEREARAMSQLSHPNCVSVIDFGVEGAPYIVMDYVEGKTLRELQNEGPVPVGRTLSIAKQLLAALAHAHNQGIIHRDIKPGNVMLSEATGMGDHVRIFDFGLAKLLDAGAGGDVSRSNIALGTPAYMSPEQTVGASVDVRSDLYSTGIVLFELLTSTKPFVESNTLKLMQHHRETPPPTLAAASGGKAFSPELEAVLAKALDKAPDGRFQTAGEFADALMAVPEHQLASHPGESLSPRRPASMPPQEAAPGPRSSLASAAKAMRSGAARALRTVETRFPAVTTLRSRINKPVLIAAAGLMAVLVLAMLWWLISGEPNDAPVGPSTEVSSEFEMVESTAKGAKDSAADAKAPAPHYAIAAALDLLKAKQYNEAVVLLLKLQRTDPQNAQFPYTLARIYFERNWLKDSLDQYRAALHKDPSLREDELLNEHLIAMLGSRRNYDTVRYVLTREVGRPALPYLLQAAKTNPDPKIRSRAMSIAETISSAR